MPTAVSSDIVETPSSTEKSAPGLQGDHEPRNFAILALFQILMRTGWIFKTESIVMPAVLDSLGGASWLRGCLPLLNRCGHSFPPIIVAPWVRSQPSKKWALAGTTVMLAVSMFLMAALWLGSWTEPPAWAPYVFLIPYALLFVCVGVNQLTFHTLQGKLIRPTRRGRLLLVSNLVGVVSAITCVYFLMTRWLRPEGGDFELVFGFAGLLFLCSAVSVTFLAEPADSYPRQFMSVREKFADVGRTFRDDTNFRRLAVVAALFGSSMMLFPHYQALARERLGLQMDNLVWWVILQNIGTAMFSVVIGPLADWSGNRAVLRLILAGVLISPLAALACVYRPDVGIGFYPFVFILVGLTPIVIKTLNNYTLEIAETGDHPRYLSGVAICVSVPVFFSPLLGWLIDMVSFEAAFLFIAMLVLVGWLLTWTLHEPRHHVASAITADPSVEE